MASALRGGNSVNKWTLGANSHPGRLRCCHQGHLITTCGAAVPGKGGGGRLRRKGAAACAGEPKTGAFTGRWAFRHHPPPPTGPGPGSAWAGVRRASRGAWRGSVRAAPRAGLRRAAGAALAPGPAVGRALLPRLGPGRLRCSRRGGAGRRGGR